VKKTLTIVSRESKLALWQAHFVRDCLAALHPELSITILGMTTEGDKAIDANLSELGGKGVFVKELEAALLNHQADIAVHCVKDMPAELPPGLCMPVCLVREEVKDVLLSRDHVLLRDLPKGARVGTSSLRRSAQLKFIRPDLQILPLRGNIDTRIKKLQNGEYDAILLAAAGVHRLGLQEAITEYLSLADHLPAPGQGALTLECREADHKTIKLIMPLNDPKTAEAVATERRLTALLGGSCDLPLAAFAEVEAEKIRFSAMVMSPDGTERILAEAEGDSAWAAQHVAQQLLQQNADRILSTVSKPLLGKRILNTRPEEQNSHLSERLSALGALVVEAPALRIGYFEAQSLNEVIQGLHFDEVIVTSQNVLPAAGSFLASWSKAHNKAILTIGGPSAKRLQMEGILAQSAPTPHNSEALLSVPSLKNVGGKKVLILKGVGGLSRLAPELTKRGADVFTFDCYERYPVQLAATVYEAKYDGVVCTSDAGLSALVASCPEAAKADFLKNQLVVMSERTQKLAKSLHFTKTPGIALVASDAGLILSVLENVTFRNGY